MECECYLAVDLCRAEDGGVFRAETKVRCARSEENDVPRWYICSSRTTL